MNSKSFHVFIVVFFILTSLHAASGIPDAPSNYVTDVADVLSDEEEKILNDTLKDFERRTTNQIFVLLAKSTEGEDFTALTLETAEKWKIGQKDKDNGILIAIYVEDHKMRIEVGYGLEGAVPDVIADKIRVHKMNPLLKEEKYFEAIMSGVQSLMEVTRGEYGNLSDEELARVENEEILSNQRGFLYITSGIVAIFSLVTFLVHRKRYSKWKKEAEKQSLKKGKEVKDKTKNYFIKWLPAAVLYGAFYVFVILYFLKIGGDTVMLIPIIGIFFLFAFFIIDIIFIVDGFSTGGGKSSIYTSGGSYSRSSFSSSSSFSGGGGGSFGGGGSGGRW